MILVVNDSNIESVISKLRSSYLVLPVQEVQEIVTKVRVEGDSALKFFEEKFDGAKLDSLRVESFEIEASSKSVETETLNSLKLSISRLEHFESFLLNGIKREIEVNDDIEVTYRFTPLRRIGVYVPRSKFSYPSSLVMCAVPAKMVGVESIVVVSPPDHEGKIDNKILAVCSLLELKEVYRVGGAQAISALAYGTESVEKVEKIFGAGGKYVTTAKYLVSKDVAVDMFAGPTELAILADSSANLRYITYDLLSQAEHSDSLVVLVSDSLEFAKEVEKEIRKFSDELSSRISIVVGYDVTTLLNFVEKLAPEHLQIIGSKFENYAPYIRNSGIVLIGEFTPSAASDYILGTNHILPTSGFSRSRGPLSPLDFMKLSVYVRSNEQTLRRLASHAIRLAKEEGFLMHAKAIEVRLNERN